MDATKLLGRPATEVAAAVRGGRVSARAVVDAHLGRIAEREPLVGAFVTVLADEARTAADALDARDDLGDLPLAGVPVAIKDVVAVAGHPTGHGSRALDRTPATEDDLLVARIRAAGGVVVGLTRVPELSVFGNSDDPGGTARSPWDPARVAGGSSGGSAAAVAAGMVPLALAADGMGSIRVPATACGILGVKPGSGTVPISFAGRDEHWFGMSTFGPHATTVADAALLLDVLAGTERFRDVAEPPAPLRVAVSTRVPAAGVRVDPRYRRATEALGALLASAGHHVAVADPPYENRTVLDLLTRWFAGAEQDVADMRADRQRLQRRTRTHAAIGRAVQRVRPVDPAQAERWKARVAGFFVDHDLLVLPAAATPPSRGHGWWDRSWSANFLQGLRWVPFFSAWNLAEVPAAVVPVGLDEQRLPVLVQLVVPHGHEQRLLAVLAQVERLQPWARTIDDG